jgi:hypothetical protein
MTTIAYIGTDGRNCARNSPLVHAAKARGWQLLRLKHLPVSGEIPDMFVVESAAVESLLNTPKAAGRPWVWVAAQPADALLAWTLNADYFLLNQSDPAEWERALDRLACRLHYLETYENTPDRSKLSLDLTLIKGRRVRIPVKDILVLEAQAEITNIYTLVSHHEKVVATRNLGYWEKRLPKGAFIRVHKKFIVNLEHVTSLGHDTLVLHGRNVPVAKRRIKDTENALLARGLELE